MGRLLFISYKILEFFSIACKDDSSRSSCLYFAVNSKIILYIEKHKVVLNNLSMQNQQIGLFISLRKFPSEK